MKRRLLGACLLLLGAGCRTTRDGLADLSPQERARVLMDRGQAADAVPLLEAEARKSPENLHVARALAEAHVKAGSTGPFLASLERRDDAVSHYQRGLVLFSSAADASGPAVAAFTRAVALAPDRAELHHRLGLALLEAERFSDARGPLLRGCELAPQSVAWRLPLAKAQWRTGDAAGAVVSIRSSLDGALSPLEAQQARALMDQIADPFLDVPKAARPKLEQAMQWLQVADVPQQAIIQLEETLRDFPDLPIVHALLGLAYARIDDAGRAVEELKRAIELAPQDGKAHLYLAEVYLGRQRPTSAREHLELAVQRHPTLGTAWSRLGDLALERQDNPSARDAFAIASRLTPDDTASRGKLALVYQLEEDWPAADRELKGALALVPDSVEFQLRLGILHTERFSRAKRPSERAEASREAQVWLRKVLDTQPQNALASRALERVQQP